MITEQNKMLKLAGINSKKSIIEAKENNKSEKNDIYLPELCMTKEELTKHLKELYNLELK